MWVSTKAQYGLRALVEIGLRAPAAVPLQVVAEAQGISQHYLEQIAAQLRRSGFIRSVRGAKGGYKLGRPTDQIFALEVVEALEGSLAPVICVSDPESCWQTGSCSTEMLWKKVDLAMRGVLGSTSLKDLVEERRQIEQRRLVQLEPSPQPSPLQAGH
ncbi:RrF2 family transcriptional regulator [Meiothermus granaticius]|uniref:HTH-type transcriptional regulator CymR n=1 Tax=Meiothermus granaticius NBRC 107808 TaxID=1227551 RepID=A0A399F8H9_9DEIN|nr:Rrf2 family transcriptional regulator [Meiothermus granaticius]RIH92964.1 HTH-type transcriptional regulator CymR [Meiothermus granaticius NBRC 107808]GEM86198.1 Rrf2 family transcriptional regulator [Meiothermus granaticius NBRC 107808]